MVCVCMDRRCDVPGRFRVKVGSAGALARAKGNTSAVARLLGATRDGLMLTLERLGIETQRR